MRILVLCDRLPHGPADGLLLRLIALLRELVPHHQFDLLCLRRAHQADSVIEGLFENVWTAQAPSRPPPPWWGPLLNWSPGSLYVQSEQIRDLLAGPIDPQRYDAIWDAGAVLFTHLGPRWDSVPVVADYVDDMVLTYRRAAKVAPRLMDRLRLQKYAYVFGRFQAETMRRLARVVVVAEEDAASFASVSSVPVTVVANGVDTGYYAPDPATPEIPGRIVFEGTMSFPPNAEAATYLVREVMPRVWAVRPDATVALVGRDPPTEVRALADERVTVTGSVPDVRTWVRQAQVFACPLLGGAGIKNKLLQAWAMERAAVATPVSTGGLAARDGVELLVRDGTEEFAQGVVSLLSEPARRIELGRAGRRAACDRFAWATMAAKFEQVLRDAASSAGRLQRART